MTIDLEGHSEVAVRCRLQSLKIQTMRWCQEVHHG